jgi:hypothetical protein
MTDIGLHVGDMKAPFCNEMSQAGKRGGFIYIILE